MIFGPSRCCRESNSALDQFSLGKAIKSASPSNHNLGNEDRRVTRCATACSSLRWPASPTGRSAALQAVGAGSRCPRWCPRDPSCASRARRACASTTPARSSPISVQIAGADPADARRAARYNVDRGAQIIDINMGCPAKKVCNVAAGSALLENEPLVARILEAVVAAVDVPVTLKIRTGPAPERRNAVRIARIAEARRHPGAGHPRPHARLRVRRRRRIRHDRRGEVARRASR